MTAVTNILLHYLVLSVDCLKILHRLVGFKKFGFERILYPWHVTVLITPGNELSVLCSPVENGAQPKRWHSWSTGRWRPVANN